jgi:hypothetical protein
MEHRTVEVTWCCTVRARVAPCARLACRIGRQSWVVACVYAVRVGLNLRLSGVYFVRSVFAGIPTSGEDVVYLLVGCSVRSSASRFPSPCGCGTKCLLCLCSFGACAVSSLLLCET